MKVTLILSVLLGVALTTPVPAPAVRREIVDLEALYKMFVRNPQVCVTENDITCCYDDGVSVCAK